jgi:fatty acid desaturase
MSGQFGFLGHDAGHRQVARTKKNSTRLSLMFGNLLLGLSIAWWVDKHNQHHAHPNTDGLDPDVAAGPIVFTMEQAAARNSAFGQWLARNQGWMFFVLMPLESLSLHVSSVQYVLGDKIKPKRLRFLERFLLLAHAVLYLVAVFTVLTPIQAVVFTIVHQGLWGSYMTLSFAPNHKGMRILTAGEERDFLRRQVLTSRNVRGGRIVDWVLGGLNYQIEHHLFPSMPRSNLRYAQPIVRAYCHEKGVPYAEEGLLKSYRQARRHLADVGAAAAA